MASFGWAGKFSSLTSFVAFFAHSAMKPRAPSNRTTLMALLDALSLHIASAHEFGLSNPQSSNLGDEVPLHRGRW